MSHKPNPDLYQPGQELGDKIQVVSESGVVEEGYSRTGACSGTCCYSTCRHFSLKRVQSQLPTLSFPLSCVFWVLLLCDPSQDLFRTHHSSKVCISSSVHSTQALRRRLPPSSLSSRIMSLGFQFVDNPIFRWVAEVCSLCLHLIKLSEVCLR